MAEQETPKLHKDRNKILAQYAEQSFSVALDEINASLKEEIEQPQVISAISGNNKKTQEWFVTLNIAATNRATKIAYWLQKMVIFQ